MTADTNNDRLGPLIKRLADAGLRSSQLLLPDDPGYRACEDSYWSNTAKLGPACIVRPASAEQVAAALGALVARGEGFAVRTGGHALPAGTNNIGGGGGVGVTVDLGLLDDVRPDDEESSGALVSIGPGARWGRVYAELERRGRVTAGGRETQTGVAGLILGGGNTWLTARLGFACDNVVAFEVVVAAEDPGDCGGGGCGRVITVDGETHADLFRALKGGWNNFGIVTRFTMRTVPCERMWGGVVVSPKEHARDYIRATVNFTGRVADYPDSSMVSTLGHSPEFGNITAWAIMVETRGVPNSRAFEELSAIPKLTDTCKPKTMLEIGSEITLPTNR